jgi:glutamyl-tRNA synthetase
MNIGASKRVINMEWDKFWSENKRFLEEKAYRYMGVSTDNAVLMTVSNVPDVEEVVSIQNHPQKPEMGFRVSYN